MEAGANPRATNNRGRTPLMCAATNGHDQVRAWRRLLC